MCLELWNQRNEKNRHKFSNANSWDEIRICELKFPDFQFSNESNLGVLYLMIFLQGFVSLRMYLLILLDSVKE